MYWHSMGFWQIDKVNDMNDLQRKGYIDDKNIYDIVVSPNEPHLACVLLVDTSSSMGESGAIHSLNEGIARFKEQLSKDGMAKRRVDVAIIEFNSIVTLVQDFSPVFRLKDIKLTANGMTAMGEAIEFAIDKVKERNNLYAEMGTPCFKPWIFMITDGLPTDNIENAIKKVQEEEAKGRFGKLRFIVLGVGNYDRNTMFQITNRVLEMKDIDFSKTFDWMAESMIEISVSRVGAEAIPGRLPVNMRKADPDRDIDVGWW